MPQFAALIKVSNCRSLGARVVLHGADVGEARSKAEELAAAEGLAFVHPFDNLDVIAGQGTIALEILEQTPDIDAIVSPVGGGGLIAGIGTAVKALRPDIEVIGVEPENAACLIAALRPSRVTASVSLKARVPRHSQRFLPASYATSRASASCSSCVAVTSTSPCWTA